MPKSNTRNAHPFLSSPSSSSPRKKPPTPPPPWSSAWSSSTSLTVDRPRRGPVLCHSQFTLRLTDASSICKPQSTQGRPSLSKASTPRRWLLPYRNSTLAVRADNRIRYQCFTRPKTDDREEEPVYPTCLVDDDWKLVVKATQAFFLRSIVLGEVQQKLYIPEGVMLLLLLRSITMCYWMENP